MNTVYLVGHIGQEVKNISNADSNRIAVFSIATNSYFENKQGEKITQTEWHNVIVFGYLAEFCLSNLAKGQKIFVCGKLVYKKFVDSSGVERMTAQIVAQSVDVFVNNSKSNE